jgi:hypothetical protein
MDAKVFVFFRRHVSHSQTWERIRSVFLLLKAETHGWIIQLPSSEQLDEFETLSL